MDYGYFRQTWGKSIDLLAPEDLSVHGVGGHVVTKGIARMKYEYFDKWGKQQHVDIATVIVKDLGTPLIIGRDFMDSVNLILDVDSNTIYCNKPTQAKPKTSLPLLVYGREKVEIPPKSTTVMSVYVDNQTVDSPVKTIGVVTNCEEGKTKLAVCEGIKVSRTYSQR